VAGKVFTAIEQSNGILESGVHGAHDTNLAPLV
jgi:hypothetical protein